MNNKIKNYINCDLCGSESRKVFPDYISKYPQVCVCKNCGHVYTVTPSTKKELDFYNYSEFASDPGANKFSNNNIDQAQFEESYLSLKNHVMPYVYRYVDPRKKKWLEFRFRTGAILKLLLEKDAEVWGIDLFEKNLNSSKIRFKNKNLFLSEVHDICSPIKENITFDVISCLSIHLLCHLPSPKKFLKKIKKFLNPNGFLIIGEKDILHMTSIEAPHPIADPNPIAHYQHMTIKTSRAYLEKAGFEIIFCDFISRKSALKHFLIIAKKIKGKKFNDLKYPIQNWKFLYNDMIEKFHSKKSNPK